jgi:DNA-binding response OmpR family regulator
MASIVLGIGYHKNECAAVRREWLPRGVLFQFVDTVSEAAWHIKQKEYVCITMFADHIDNDQLAELRGEKQTPILLLSRVSDIVERRKYLEEGIARIIPSVSQRYDAGFKSSGKNAVQYYLDVPAMLDRQVTIVSNEDLFFCLEYRLVEVRGQSIALTPTEFDILALLIMHPRQVFTFEMTFQLVWGYEYAAASRQVLWNHVSHLRQKMKIYPDLPDLIKTVRSVGYKYDPA